MKQVLIAKSPLFLNAPRHSILCTSLFRYPSFFLLAAATMFITSCQKEELQSSSQKRDPMNNSQKQDIVTTSQKQEGKKNCVPFKATFTTTSEVVQAGTTENPIEIDHIFGWGEGTHIGKARIDVYAESNINDLPPTFFITTKGTFTAANGDKIFGASSGEVAAPNFDTGEISFTGHVSIIGGTGRFVGASGDLLSTVSGNIYTTVTNTFNGTICF